MVGGRGSTLDGESTKDEALDGREVAADEMEGEELEPSRIERNESRSVSPVRGRR